MLPAAMGRTAYLEWSKGLPLRGLFKLAQGAFRNPAVQEHPGLGAPLDQAVVHCPLLSDRLDESKIEQLRAWGAGLVADGNQEFRATGKAILLLIEEIERLHVDVWNAKTTQGQEQPDQADGDGQLQATLDRTLRARLSRVRRR